MTQVSGKIVHEHVDKQKMANSVGAIAILVFAFCYHIGLLGKILAVFWPMQAMTPEISNYLNGMSSPESSATFTYMIFRVAEFAFGAIGTVIIASYSGLLYIFNDIKEGGVSVFNHYKERQAQTETYQAVVTPVADTVVTDATNKIPVPVEMRPAISALHNSIKKDRAAREALEIRVALLEANVQIDPKTELDMLPLEEQVTRLKQLLEAKPAPKPSAKRG